MLVLCNRLFSMCVGIAIIFYKSASRSFRSDAQPSLLQRLKPASPVYAYSAVALLNFAATFCRELLWLMMFCFLVVLNDYIRGYRIRSPEIRRLYVCFLSNFDLFGVNSNKLLYLL